MRSGLIVHKSKGKLIGEDYVKVLLDTHKTAMGIAIASDGVVDNTTYLSDEVVLADQFKDAQNTYKDYDVFFYFQNCEDLDKEFDIDSVQPFNVLTRSGQGKEDDVTLLSVMLDIDYTRFAKGEEGSAWPEYHLMAKYLAEKIRACYKRNGEDLASTLKELNTDIAKTEVLAMIDNRGDILIIPGTGAAFAYTDNNLGRRYSWGYASKHLGVASDLEQKEPPKVVDVAVKPLSLRDRKKGLTTGTAPVTPVESKPEPTKEPVKEEPRLNPEKVNPEDKSGPGASFKIIDKDGMKWVEFTSNVFTHLKTAWNRNTAAPRPSDEKKVKEGFPVAALRVGSPIFMYLEDLAKASGTQVTAFRDAMAKAKKELEDKEAKAKAAVDNPLVLGVEDRKKAIELDKDNGLFGYTAEQIKEEIKEAASFSEQTGLKLDRWMTMATRGLQKVPKFVLIALLNQYRLQQLEAAAPAEQTKTEETPTATATKPSLRDRKRAA